MKKKLTALLLVAYVSLSLAGCKDKTDMSAAARGMKEESIVYIDDGAVALAGPYQSAENDGSRGSKSRRASCDCNGSLDLANAQRESGRLSALSWSTDLESCAQIRAIEIVSTFSHTRQTTEATGTPSTVICCGWRIWQRVIRRQKVL